MARLPELPHFDVLARRAKPVEVIHPGYSPQKKVTLLSLPAYPRFAAPTDGGVPYGVAHRLVLDACSPRPSSCQLQFVSRQRHIPSRRSRADANATCGFFATSENSPSSVWSLIYACRSILRKRGHHSFVFHTPSAQARIAS